MDYEDVFKSIWEFLPIVADAHKLAAQLNWMLRARCVKLSQSHGDYIRGRRLKTSITVKADGAVILETVGRGKAALRWLDRMKGKKMISLIN